MKSYKYITVDGKEYRSEVLTIPANKLNLNKIPAIIFLHDKKEAERRRKLGERLPNKFKITCIEDLPLDDEVSTDEKEAEKIVSHERIVLTDQKFNVIHGHEAVLKAKETGRTLIVLRITTPLSKKEVFLIQFRHAAKEGMLFPSIRWEAIRILNDEHGMELKVIRDLMAGPKGKKPTLKDVTSELRVGRYFDKHSGRTIDSRGFEFDKHSFSNLKYLVGNNAIFEEMSKSPEKETHFLDMAIIATKSGDKRLNTIIPPLMENSDTRELLITSGLEVSRDLQRAKYPEQNKEHHPQNDLLAVISKLNRTEMLVFLKKQLEVRPLANKLFQSVLEINRIVAELSPLAHKELLKGLTDIDPSVNADLLAESYPDLVVEAIRSKQAKYGKVLSKVR